MRHAFARSTILGLGFLLTTTMVGCGGGEDYGSPVTVTGTVTLDSKPLADANVTFHSYEEGLPAEYRSKMTKTNAEGKYEMQEVYPAEYKVMVQKFNYDAEEASADGGVAADDPLAEYGPNSKLTATVSADKTTHDLTLNSK